MLAVSHSLGLGFRLDGYDGSAFEPELAIELLLKDTLKNCYLASGNNMQISRPDLPLYLPGNGSLLLAVAAMAAGYEGCMEKFPGFPKDGQWTVEYENIQKLP